MFHRRKTWVPCYTCLPMLKPDIAVMVPSKPTLVSRVILHPVKMCLNVAGDEYKGQEGSSPTQRFRFCGDGWTSYVDLIRKLILLSSIDQRSCQPFLRCSTLSYLIHSPCLAWEMAFIHLILFYYFHTLLTTSFLLWAGPAFCHLGGATLSPIPPLPCCTCPTISPIWRAAFGSSTDLFAAHFLPVFNTGAVSLTHLSCHFTEVIFSLTLAHLNSSVKPETGSCNIPLL